MIGGSFGSIGGFSRRGLALFSPEGTLDLDFNPDLGGYVYSTASQVDGKIIVGGAFSVSPPAPRAYLARLNANGTLDSGFTTDTDGIVHSTAILADGRILVAGEFTSVGGTPRNYLAALTNDPAAQILSVSGATRVQWQRAGASPETSRTTFELSTDGGTAWSPLGVGTRIAGGWELASLNLPSAGLVRGRATVHGGQHNAGTGLIETSTAFNVGSVPAPKLTNLSRVGNSVFQFGFTNLSGKVFTTVATTNLSLPSTNWTVLGPATEISPGLYQFTDPQADRKSVV